MRPPHPPPLNKTSSSPWMNESIDSRKLSGELRQVSSQFFMLKGFSDPWFRGFLNSQVFGKQIHYSLFQKQIHYTLFQKQILFSLFQKQIHYTLFQKQIHYTLFQKQIHYTLFQKQILYTLFQKQIHYTLFQKQILYALFQKFSIHDFIWCSRIPEYSDYIFLKKS